MADSAHLNPIADAQPASDAMDGRDAGGQEWKNLAILADIPLRLSVEVGAITMRLFEAMDIAEGSIVELDRQSHELLDIMANGTLIAKGEVVTVNNRFGIRVVDIVPNDMRSTGKERRS